MSNVLELKKKSTYELEEILDCMVSIKAKLYDYRHVISEKSEIVETVQKQINTICRILDKKENKY